jgi:subtilisin family serine protease
VRIEADDVALAAQEIAAASDLTVVKDLGDGFVVLQAAGDPSRASVQRLAIRSAAARANAAAANPTLSTPSSLLGEAVARARVAMVEEDYVIQAQAAAPAECPSGSCPGMWGFNAARIPQAWALASMASNQVRGSVIDTGAQYEHSELAGQAVPALGATFSSGARVGNGADDNGHGSHVTGVMAGRWGQGQVAGIVGNAAIVECKFLDAQGSGYTSDAIQCIKHVASQNAQAVINNSWAGGGYSDALFAAIRDYVCAKNGLFVAAAGNSGVDMKLSGGGTFPAAYATYPGGECVLPVAATDNTGTLASFSNYGASVPIAAPGVGIRSSVYSNSSTEALAVWSGTSMASPFVAGVALLLRNELPALSATQIKQALVSTATTPVKPYGGTRTIAGGLLDAEAALLAARAMTPASNPAPPPPAPPPPAPTNPTTPVTPVTPPPAPPTTPPTKKCSCRTRRGYCPATCNTNGACAYKLRPRNGRC